MAKSDNDIQTILDASRAHLVRIEQHYEDAARGRNAMPNDSMLGIKNLLENLKSCLDYFTHDIRERYHPNLATAKNDKANFPFSNDAKHFAGVVKDKVCPGLDVSCPPLYQYLESLRYDNPASAWLKRMNQARNSHTHRSFLSAQERTDRRTTFLTTRGAPGALAGFAEGSSVTFNNVGIVTPEGGIERLNAQLLPDGNVVGADPRLVSVEKRTLMYYQFSGTTVPALQVLKESIDGVEAVVKAVRQYL
jgi:hypothetical protein